MNRMTRSRSHSSGARIRPAAAAVAKPAPDTALANDFAKQTETEIVPNDSKPIGAILPAQPLTANLLTPREEFWNLKLVVGFTALLALYFGICEPPFLQAICAAAAVAVACGLLLVDEENCAATRQFDKK